MEGVGGVEKFSLFNDGRLALGGTPSPRYDALLTLSDDATYGSASGPVSFAERFVSVYDTADATQSHLGALFAANMSVANPGNSVQGLESFITTTHTTGDIPLVLGIIANVELFGAGGLITEARAFTGSVFTGAAGTITDARVYFANDTDLGTGTITNFYGFYATDLNYGTNNWGVYMDGSTPNYFGGSVGIGDTTPNADLHVSRSGVPVFQLESTGASDVRQVMTNAAATWRIVVEGTGGFKIRDQDAATDPFQIEEGAPENLLKLDSSGSGRVGVGIGSPARQFHVDGGNVEFSRSDANMQIFVQAADANTGSLFFQNTASNVWEMGRINSGSDQDFFVYNHNLTEFAFRIDRQDNRVLISNGDLSVNAGDGAAGNLNSYTNVSSKSVTVSSSAGATLTANNLIPAGVVLIGLTARVTTSFGTSGGLTSFDVGDSGDQNRWNNNMALTSGTTMNHDDATADPAGVWAAGPRDVILISEGGNFDGTGTIELLSHYLDLTAPTG